jgi:2-desacetyl-2-hydroxyethyl bacteriochlorophyllide A dehydrogenase
MTAAVLSAIPTRQLEITQRAVPKPRSAGDVLLRVLACGICGTDVHILEGRSYRPELPFVLGHEVVGEVVEAPDDSVVTVGEVAAVSPFRGCLSCENCRAGDQRLCQVANVVNGVIGRDGGFAEFELVHQSQLVPVPDGLSPTVGASLVDCGPTAMNAVSALGSRTPERVVITGGGAIGRLVAQLLSSSVARVTVVEPMEARREAITVHPAVDTIPDGGALDDPIDVVVECSGSSAALEWALNRLAPHGLLVLAGYSTLEDFDFGRLSRKELDVRGVRSGSAAQLGAVLRLAADSAIEVAGPDIWKLSEVNEAFAALAADQPPAKVVLVPAAQVDTH